MVINNKGAKIAIFDRQLLLQNNKRYQGFFADYNFLYLKIANIILENINLQNRIFADIYEINQKTDFFVKNLHYENYHSCSFADICDEENINFLPSENPQQKYDLIINNLDLHFINQVPNFLLKIKHKLKKNGVFIASFFGDDNLYELRIAMLKAENEVYGGISSRMPPTIDIKTSAQLLAQVGFKNSIADLEKIIVEYNHPIALLKDLKYSGQGNIMFERSRKFFSKKLLQNLLAKYQDFYDNDNKIYPATFSVITISGTNLDE